MSPLPCPRGSMGSALSVCVGGLGMTGDFAEGASCDSPDTLANSGACVLIPKQKAHEGPQEETRGKPWAFLHFQVRASHPPGPQGKESTDENKHSQQHKPGQNQMPHSKTLQPGMRYLLMCKTIKLHAFKQHPDRKVYGRRPRH